MVISTVIGHIYIYGEIGKQVTLDTVLKNISPKNSEYIVHVHSPGGDVFEGYAIYNAIKNTGKEITVHIEGVCASIATLIAAAGTKIIMNTKSQFMIHNPRISSMGGEAKDLRNVAGQLDKIKSQLIESWIGRTHLSIEELSRMYDNETWLNPEQAVELGFADEITEVLKAAAYADVKKYSRMENKKNIIAQIGKLIDNFFNPQNITETLSDGRVVEVGEDGTISLEDGSALADGTYELAGGKKITVAGGKITETIEPEAKTEEPTDDKTETTEDMELKEKLAAAEARIKELESAVQAKTNEAAQAEVKVKTYENKLNTELKGLKEQLKKFENTTAGDTTPPRKAEKPVDDKGQPIVDPMQAFFKERVIDKRNTD